MHGHKYSTARYVWKGVPFVGPLIIRKLLRRDHQTSSILSLRFSHPLRMIPMTGNAPTFSILPLRPPVCTASRPQI